MRQFVFIPCLPAPGFPFKFAYGPIAALLRFSPALPHDLAQRGERDGTKPDRVGRQGAQRIQVAEGRAPVLLQSERSADQVEDVRERGRLTNDEVRVGG